MEAHNRFAEQVAETGGKIVSGRALQPTMTATSIRGDVVTDGPFAETKEALGGYYLIEAPDLDHALAIGKLCPARFGGVEVRPIMVFGGSDRIYRRRPLPATGRPTEPAPAEPGRPAGGDQAIRAGPLSPTRTVASGPSCSPRRRASPATSTWPRSACRTPTSRRSQPGRARASRATRVPG